MPLGSSTGHQQAAFIGCSAGGSRRGSECCPAGRGVPSGWSLSRRGRLFHADWPADHPRRIRPFLQRREARRCLSRQYRCPAFSCSSQAGQARGQPGPPDAKADAGCGRIFSVHNWSPANDLIRRLPAGLLPMACWNACKSPGWARGGSYPAVRRADLPACRPSPVLVRSIRTPNRG